MDAVIDEQLDATAAEDEARYKLSALVETLQKLADDQVRRKSVVEDRWLDDLRAFHGRYDEVTEGQLKESNKSRAFVKVTRKKTNSWDARLGSLLFPTDDENWDIRSTPVPTLHEEAKKAVEEAMQALAQANKQQEAAAQQQAMAQQQADPAAQQQLMAGAQQAEAQAAGMAQMAQAKLNEHGIMLAAVEEAVKRSGAMRNEMRDQLLECDYAAEARKVIRDACRLGTGILKGPLAGDKARGKWISTDGQFVYQRETDPAPVYRWVDPWAYFPDMSALTPGDREFEFERHLWSAKELRRLAREAGFNKRAVRELLEDRKHGMTVTDSSMSYLTSLRAITGTSDVIKDRMVGWEYHGRLTCEEIALVLRALGDDETAEEYEKEEDPLHEMPVICFFCEGKILKLSAVYPLDSGESLYSLFILEPSEAGLFGYGIPAIMSDSQKSLNGAWRMALDNAALSVGPQIFLDREAIEPANKQWELAPRKIWYKRKGAVMGDGKVLEVANIPNNVEEIMNIVRTSRQFIDDETALPVQAEGELTDNPNITATATNFMSLASNITFRRVVKNFDDGITAPSIRRLYDWNMQHNSRTDIKGDMKIVALGSSHLLQREMQQQMLLNIAQNWLTHPKLGQMIKPYEAAAESLRSAMIQPDVIMVTKDAYEKAIEAEAAAAAQQPPQQDPTVVAAQARLEAAKIDAESRLQVANLQRETELLKLADQKELTLEKLRTMLGMKEIDTDHKERVFAAEAALEEERERKAAARGEKPTGSGGYLSA